MPEISKNRSDTGTGAPHSYVPGITRLREVKGYYVLPMDLYTEKPEERQQRLNLLEHWRASMKAGGEVRRGISAFLDDMKRVRADVHVDRSEGKIVVTVTPRGLDERKRIQQYFDLHLPHNTHPRITLNLLRVPRTSRQWSREDRRNLRLADRTAQRVKLADIRRGQPSTDEG